MHAARTIFSDVHRNAAPGARIGTTWLVTDEPQFVLAARHGIELVPVVTSLVTQIVFELAIGVVLLLQLEAPSAFASA